MGSLHGPMVYKGTKREEHRIGGKLYGFVCMPTPKFFRFALFILVFCQIIGCRTESNLNSLPFYIASWLNDYESKVNKMALGQRDTSGTESKVLM